MKKISWLLLVFLLFSTLFVKAAVGKNGTATQLIFGAIQQEGAGPQEQAVTYRMASDAIKLINYNLKFHNANITIYAKPQMGTYFEALDRLTKRKIDIVVLPSFNYLAGGQDKDFRLLGIMDYPKPWKCALLVRRDSSLSDINLLLKNSGRYRIAYVNELSASGYIVPKIFFTDVKARFDDELFSDGHLSSITKLLRNEYDKNTVIAVDEAVYDDFARAMPQANQMLRKIFSIENPYIFKDCLFVSGNVDDATLRILKEAVDMSKIKKIKDLRERQKITALVNEVSRRAHFSSIVTDVDEKVFDYLNNYLARYDFKFTERFSTERVLTKIAEDIDRRSALDKKYQPKIALVLSGGGASGSYQAGVLKALDEKLKEFNQTSRKNKKALSVDMVVSTSIGALNGILFSLGDINRLSNIWQNMKSEDVFTPYWKYQLIKKHLNHPIIMALLDLFALFVFVVLIRASWQFDFRQLDLKEDVFPVIIVGLIAVIAMLLFQDIASFIVFLTVLICLGCASIGYLKQLESYLLIKVERWFAKEGGIYKSVRVALSTIFVIAPALLFAFILITDTRMYFLPALISALLLGGFLVGKALSIRTVNNRYMRGVRSYSQVATLVIGFVAIYYLLSFFKTGSAVFSIRGYENIITTNLSKIAGDQPKVAKELLSMDIVNNRLSKELIITASDLRRQEDVYFYFIPKSQKASYLPVGPLWVSLKKYPEKLIDAMVGTGSIVLLSPIKEMTVGKRSLMLVDGGYLHFVPVDAATSRGATHLIIVMCSEDTKHDIRPEDWNFFQYLSETSTFSTYGSQTLDYFGREKRMSFLIAPRERRVDKTDFDGRRYKGKYVTLKDFMQEGYEDAQGKENGFRQLSAGEFILN